MQSKNEENQDTRRLQHFVVDKEADNDIQYQ